MTREKIQQLRHSVEIPSWACGSDMAAMLAWCRQHVGGAPDELWSVYAGRFYFRNQAAADKFRVSFSKEAA
jgi:hypothetical protein